MPKESPSLVENGDGSVVRLDPKVSNAVDGNGVRRPNGGEFALNQASRVVLEDEAASALTTQRLPLGSGQDWSGWPGSG